jgi:aminopeptidase N
VSRDLDSEAGHGATSAGDPYVPHSGNGGYRVRHYALDLEYRVAANHLTGRAAIDLVTVQALSRLSFDLAGLAVSKVSIDGQRAKKFATRGQKLHVWPAHPMAAGAEIRLEVQYAGNPRPVRGSWGHVGWEELADGAIVASQPNGAPSWFPCDDHPSAKATYRISVTTDSPYRVVSNGRLVDRQVRSSLTRWVFEQAQPMASYLATVAVGQYAVFEIAGSQVDGGGVGGRAPVQRVAAPARVQNEVAHDLARQPQMMALFCERFGPYPFDGYTVVVTDDDLEIPVEAQGISTFGANHLDGSRDQERLVAHELAHQWFGNSLTVASWQHIWLNEGFACYAEWLWSEASGGATADTLARQCHAVLTGLPADLVVADPGPELMFDDRLYKRGALTLHALRSRLGDDAFFALLQAWVSRHRHDVVTTADFVFLAQQHSATPVAELFNEWLDKPELPSLPDPR